MSASLFFAITCATLPFITASYYISYNSFTWTNAESFCQNHCNSNLASIHSDPELSAIQQLTNDSLISTNLWIGLFENSSGHYHWSDNTPFDYGSDKIISNTAQKFELTTDTFSFNNINGNSIKQMFICNECQWNTLSKYINIQNTISESPNTAELKCNNLYSTSLASIHSISDNTNIQLISQLSDYSDGSFIGLNDITTENTYLWFDNSPINYMQNITNNDDTKDCMYTNALSNYDWTATDCDTITNSIGIICNAPHLFCNANDWSSDTPTKWIFGVDCELYNDNDPLDIYTIRNYLNNGYGYTQLSLEYIWKIDLNSNYDSNSFSGISLSFENMNESIPDTDTRKFRSFFIGIHYQKKNIRLFKRNVATGDLEESNIITSGVNLTEYNILNVEYNNRTLIISLNGNDQYLLPQDIDDEIPADFNIRSIDLKNSKVSSFSKSLYVNGYADIIYPTIAPTAEPTANPAIPPSTINPTIIPTIYPTKTPTDNPSITPTDNPSLTPSINPTNIPTISPTKTPTDNPSETPTDTPSITPSIYPTITPTASPSGVPSVSPTLMPTWYPSVRPTTVEPTTSEPTATPTSPTVGPSVTPSVSPTTAEPTSKSPTLTPTESPTLPICNMDNAIFAKWSRSYLSILIYHKTKAEQVDKILMKNGELIDDCKSIFATKTMTLLGDDARCTWVENENQARLLSVNEDVLLLIDLAATSIINQTDSMIFLPKEVGPIQYLCVPTGEYEDIMLPQIRRPINPYPPDIILSSASTSIGVCDDLVLDARSTTFMGGRDNGEFIWSIFHRFKKVNYFNHYYGSYVEIGNKLIENKLSLYNITLTVTNWYNETSSLIFNVFISDQAVPKLSLSGTHIYKATRIYLYGYVNIYSEVSFNKRCLTNNAPEIKYNLSWSASAIKLYNDTMIMNTNKLDNLNTYLQSDYYNIEDIAIYAANYLQSGLLYTFTLNLFCIGDDYNCNIYSTHQLTYDYSDLKCGITGNDIQIINIDPILDDLYSVKLPINGYKLTFDPDMKFSVSGKKSKTSKQHLVWNWNCIDIYLNNTCDFFINDNTAPTIKINLGSYKWEYLTSYKFEFTMEVYDGSNLVRDSCFDIFLLEIITSIPPISYSPTNIPTNAPLITTKSPTFNPTQYPTNNPSINPSIYPTISPTLYPSAYPSVRPTSYPTITTPPEVHIVSCGTVLTDNYNITIQANKTTIYPTITFELDLLFDATVTMSTCGSNYDTILTLLDNNSSILDRCDDCGFGPTASCGSCCGATLPVKGDSAITRALLGGYTYYFEMDYNPKTPHGDILTYYIDIQCVTGQPTNSPSKSPSKTPTQIPTTLTTIPTISPIPTITPTISPTIRPTRGPTIEGKRRKLFVVQVSTLQTRVNVKNRVGLIGDVMNYDVTELSNIYYEWSETKGLLNNTELINYSDNVYDITAKNLILKENVLTSGNIYSFKLTVKQYEYPLDLNDIQRRRRRLAIVNNTLIGFGESAPIEIYVYRTPTIHHNSFQVIPKCDNIYDSIYDLITTKHTLTLSADDDFVPLMYEFGYNKSNVTNYFHPSLLSDSTIYNIFLPIGEFEIFGNVINAVASKSTKYKNCSIELLDYSQCIITWKIDIIDDYITDIRADSTYSIDEIYSYIFSQTDIYLNYLYDYIPITTSNNSDKCVEESIKQIIKALDEYVNITCDTYRWSVSLSQTMSLLMNLITLNNSSLSDTFYKNEYLLIIKDLLFDTLDPCGCINNFTQVEDLYLLGESIINQVPAVYYQDTDITDCLSPIISDPNYHQLLYDLASPVIILMNSIPYNESNEIYDLLLDSIYIAELALISTNIPQTLICSDYADISTCTFRIDNKCHDINAQNISLHVGDSRIYIPNDITCDEQQDTDLTWVVVNFPGAALELTDDDTGDTAASNNPGCNDKIFLENSLSITISLGGNLSNHSIKNFDHSQLAENIQFSFNCHGKCNDSFQCVWFDTENDIWLSNGCNTSIRYDLNEILCVCDIHSELTPFATVHTTHGYKCEDPFTSGWLNSVIWDILIWIFFSVFVLIFCYAMFLCYRYYFTFEWRDISVFAIGLIGITALIYAFICLFGYLTKQTILTLTNEEREASNEKIQLYTLFLLLPQLIYFIIFSIIFYSWYCLIHSVFLPDIDISKKKKN